MWSRSQLDFSFYTYCLENELQNKYSSLLYHTCLKKKSIQLLACHQVLTQVNCTDWKENILIHEREAYIKQIFGCYACISGLMEMTDNKVSLNDKSKRFYILQLAARSHEMDAFHLRGLQIQMICHSKLQAGACWRVQMVCSL